ncbi:hypothetical protein Vi05172_g780 [Venturia inaequalis]|nr:hypothetical protein Vi05172_g780 [Venturia inaequalis]
MAGTVADVHVALSLTATSNSIVQVQVSPPPSDGSIPQQLVSVLSVLTLEVLP